MKKKLVTHPGILLQEDFLDEMGISQYALAEAIGVPRTRISMICKGERAITADTALRLALFFDTSAEYWLNLQKHYDLVMAEAVFTPPKNFTTAEKLMRA